MLRVGNISGFWGDRASAAAEVVRGGPVDVITGDYLAELTLAILQRGRRKDPAGGYVPSFLRQMEEVLGECLARGIRVVSNAGGLNPRGLAEALARMAARVGLRPRIAVVDGDDLVARLDELAGAGEAFRHLDRGEPLGERRGRVLTANAYLGGWAIKEALDRGAEVVITGRVADASLVVGPAAARFGWRRDDWDRLAGAAVAGHVLECGTQATGGNYPFPDEVPMARPLGFPLAEIAEDGSFVVCKHDGTGGRVSVGTVTAQLLYEIDEPGYRTPDVVARFDTLRLEQVGPDRVRVSGARGAPPPATAKVAMNLDGGFRNTVDLLLAGLDVAGRARVLEEQLLASLGGRGRLAGFEAALVRRPAADAACNADALAQLRISATDPDREAVGRRFSARVVELVLASVPGVTLAAPPGDAAPVLVYWPTLVDAGQVHARATLGDEAFTVAARVDGAAPEEPAAPEVPPARAWGETESVPLGRLFGARSGDKGGNANLGVWARDGEAFAYLHAHLTAARLQALAPELAGYAVERHVLANLRALNFVIRGLLGDGAAASTRVDPQAKTLAEYLRTRAIDVPRRLLGPVARAVCPRATRATLVRQCAALGLAPGDTVMVHASLRAVGPVLGGPPEVVAAIVEAVGEAGTVLVYLGCDAPYDDLGRGLYDPADEAFIAEHCPPFDPHHSPASRAFGAFAEFFRVRPDVRVSDHVGARMAAVGARAGWLTREHPRDHGLGEGSPLARLCEAGGKLLLLGSDPDNVTLLHHAEAVAPIADKREVRIQIPRLREGVRVWQPVVEYDSARGICDWPDRFFAAIVEAFVAAGHARSGPVGGATSHLFAARDLVAFAVPRMVAAAAELRGA